MHSELDHPENPEMIVGTEFEHIETGNLAGGEAYLSEAVSRKSDIDRRFLIKHFYENGATTEELYESETLAQNAADNHHQAVLASILFDRKLRTSVMLKAAKDTNTIQDLLVQWEDSPPEDQETEYYDMGRLKESIAIIKSLLGALDGIHNDIKKPTLHMDLSPSNIMWGKNIAHGTAYLIDFSCCVKVGHKVNDSRRTTLSFAAPETSIPGKILTPAADIYSVGAVFLLLVAGMAAASNEKGEKKWSVRQLPGAGNCNVTDPISTLEIPEAYKGKLSEVIIKATAPIKRRYQTASEMLTDIAELERIISGRSMTPETLFRGSEILFERACRSDGQFNYIPDEDLLTSAVDCDTKEEVDPLTQNTILLGGGGSGKTTWVYVLWKQCLEEWKRDPKQSPIPIFVPLNTFDSKRSNWDFFIRDYIAEAYFSDLSKDDGKRRADLWGMLSSKSSYILFLDGINEAINNTMLIEEIYKLVSLERVNVLLTSRNNLGDGWDDVKKLFHVAELKSLDDGLVIKKLHKAERRSPSRKLLETLRRPMFLAMYLQLEITEKKVETPGQILYEHHKHLANAYKTGHHGRDIEARFEFILGYILPRLATTINKLAFNYNELYDVAELIYADAVAVNRRFKKLKSNDMDIGDIVGDVLHECGILRNISAENDYMPDNYVFVHQNYLEFYQALDIYNQMTAFKGGRELPKILTVGILPDTVMQFLGDLCGEHEFRTKTDCSGEPSPVEKWMQNNCAGRKDRAAQMAVRNLIEVMKRSRDSKVTANYNNLDLTLSDFYNCILPYSSFRESVFSENTFLFSGHRYTICEMLIASNKHWIITSSELERQVLIHDFETGSLIRKIDCPGNVLSMALSHDESMLAIGLLGNKSVVQLCSLDGQQDLILLSSEQPSVVDGTLNANLERSCRYLSFDLSGRILCAISGNGLAIYWDVRSSWDVRQGKKFGELELTGVPPKYRMSAGGLKLVNRSQSGFSVFSIGLGIPPQEIDTSDIALVDLAISQDGEHVVGLDKNNRLHCWGVDGSGHLSAPEQVEGPRFYGMLNEEVWMVLEDSVFWNTDKFLHRWDLRNNEINQEKHLGDINIFRVSQDEKYYATVMGTEVCVVELETLTNRKTFQVASYPNISKMFLVDYRTSVRYTPCGNVQLWDFCTEEFRSVGNFSLRYSKKWKEYVSTRNLDEGIVLEMNESRTMLNVWELLKGKSTFEGDFRNIPLEEIRYNPAQRTITLFNRYKNKVCIYRAKGDGGYGKSVFETECVGDVSYEFVGNTLVLENRLGMMKIIRSDGKCTCLDNQSFSSHSNQLRFSVSDLLEIPGCEDCFLVVASDLRVFLWNGETFIVLDDRDGSLKQVAVKKVLYFDPTGSYTIKVPEEVAAWLSLMDTSVGRLILLNRGVNPSYAGKSVKSDGGYNIKISKNGKTAAAWELHKGRVWDTQSGKIYNLPDEDFVNIWRVGLSDDGSKLTTLSLSGEVVLTDLETGQQKVWKPTCAMDISFCDFRGTYANEGLKYILKQNGAIVDEI